MSMVVSISHIDHWSGLWYWLTFSFREWSKIYVYAMLITGQDASMGGKAVHRASILGQPFYLVLTVQVRGQNWRFTLKIKIYK